jgi:hypothetical protein
MSVKRCFICTFIGGLTPDRSSRTVNIIFLLNRIQYVNCSLRSQSRVLCTIVYTGTYGATCQTAHLASVNGLTQCTQKCTV